MTETKSLDPAAVPEPVDPAGKPAGMANDPNQTRLLPVTSVLGKHDMADGHGVDAADLHHAADEPKPMRTPSSWLKKLSPAQIIWILLSIFLTFLVLFFWLIMQGRPKNKIAKPAAGEQFEETAENTDSDASRILKSKLARQAVQADQILTDDELAGLAPLAVKAGGPVISAAADPELAAVVDAFKKRLQMTVDSKSTTRGSMVTRESKGDFRGFKINVEEKFESQKIISEEVTVTFPKKGVIKTVNRVLESCRDSDPERFTQELQNAGLAIVKLPSQPGSNVIGVQIRAVGISGKPVAADLLISGKSVGNITLGMTTVQMENMLLSSYIVLKRKVLVDDIYHDVYKVLDQSNDPLFFIYENYNVVWGISIISEFFKTGNGIGIGSTLGDMRINYPKVTVGISDKKIPFVKIDGVDGLFVIQNGGLDIKKRVFSSHAKVISILIGNSLEFE